ncbi:HAD family hydrolase [Bacillus marasmi]|uniref:HAD family hydrolase n=1 Tax=Bacillus marasmi TaxID=1926279 RepID=UPI001FE68887|nr:HAD family hydrolase [Bacillus marasmi]
MKCVSLDLDGTLLNSHFEMTEKSVNTIVNLQEQGIEVIINTGRAFTDVVKVPGIRELNCPIVCVNGSILFSKTGELLFEATLRREIYEPIISILTDLDVGILIYTDKGGFPSTLPPLHSKSKTELDEMFTSFDYHGLLMKDDLKIYKIIALVYPEQLERVDEVKKALAHFENISMASSFPNNVEITSREAHKGRAILRYAELNDIEFEEIYAFGDGGNDLSQFEVATKSVAMANAPKEIREAADIITKSNDEDGISYAVKELLKLI